ncbi:MAG: hypothetical protein J2P17_08685 [Mycobacterium sp.]|nr:hypothetical protein [Mycobacterium sp.]
MPTELKIDVVRAGLTIKGLHDRIKVQLPDFGSKWKLYKLVEGYPGVHIDEPERIAIDQILADAIKTTRAV